MDRRNFLSKSGALCALGLISTSALLESCQKKNLSNPQGPSVNFTIDISQSTYSALKSNGGSVASHGVVIVNENGSYKAVAQSCTHQGCSVSFSKSNNEFICPCHGGVYDINGNVVSGPPPAPLKSYSINQNGNILTISG